MARKNKNNSRQKGKRHSSNDIEKPKRASNSPELRQPNIISRTIGRVEILILSVFSIIVPTSDNYSDLGLSFKFLTGWYKPLENATFYNQTSRSDEKIEAKPQYLYALFTFLPVLVSFLFTVLHWRTVETTGQKRWKTLPLLILQIWPQSRVCRILHFFRTGNKKWMAEKDYFEMELSTIEPFLEAVPQVIVLLCIGFLSGSGGSNGRVYSCAPQNCGIVSLLPWVDPWFFGTFLLSVFSASFGMTRFLKVGPMTLVPRNSYGLSFFIALFLVAAAVISKGTALALLLLWKPGTSESTYQYVLDIAFWLGTCVLPSLFYGIFLSIWTVGFKKTFTKLIPRFPGLFLFPIFGLFVFGPKSQQNCQCPSYGNNEMQVSFTHTYVNLSLWFFGFTSTCLISDPLRSVILLSPLVFVMFLLLLLFHLLEKTCCIGCCSPSCLPFTERSVFVEDSDKQDTEQQQQQQQSEGDFEMMRIA